MNIKFKLSLLLLLVSLDMFVFNIKGVNLRLFYLPCIFYLTLDFLKYHSNNGCSYMKGVISSIKIIFSIFLLLLLHTFCFSVDVSSSMKNIILLLFNSISGLYIYYLIRYNLNPIIFSDILKYNIILTCSIVIIQFLLSVLHIYQPIKYGLEGIGRYGRPAAFFLDPGWLAWWVGFLFIFYRLLNEKFNQKQNKKVAIFIFIAAIFSSSRVLMFLFLFALVMIKRSKYFILVFMSLVIILFPFLALTGGIPENLYYDLVDLDRNPRLNDATLIISSVFSDGRQFVGLGSGTLYVLNEIYEWRNFTSSNVLALSVFYEYGYFGLSVVIFLFLFAYSHLVKKLKIIFFLLFFMLNFHNATLKTLFWVIVGMLFAINWIVKNKKYSSS